MKSVSEEYNKPLTYLINKTISQGHFPEELKLARVIPIYKGENDQLIQNYRPISVLPFFSKIFEKIIFNHVINFLNDNNVLYDYQFGFRKQHSTSHAIITLVERVEKALDTGKVVVGVFLDLKKAFDTVNHTILLHKQIWYTRNCFKMVFKLSVLQKTVCPNMMVANQMLNKLPMGYPKDQSWDHFSLFYTLMTFQEHPTSFSQ